MPLSFRRSLPITGVAVLMTGALDVVETPATPAPPVGSDRGRPSSDLEPLVVRVREEFREMPGLQLTASQAMRLWGMEAETCHKVIAALVSAAYLQWTNSGSVRRT